MDVWHDRGTSHFLTEGFLKEGALVLSEVHPCFDARSEAPHVRSSVPTIYSCPKN